mmetsp:Transcript_18717/g.23726  ORF Transcript_18717/g.23726 Transcript_18717/m.23726 type:complete len:94 (-) Transcript_18717:583-864(-)
MVRFVCVLTQCMIVGRHMHRTLLIHKKAVYIAPVVPPCSNVVIQPSTKPAKINNGRNYKLMRHTSLLNSGKHSASESALSSSFTAISLLFSTP